MKSNDFLRRALGSRKNLRIDYCGLIRNKSDNYLSRIFGVAYNPFIKENIRDCYFHYKQASLLRIWLSRLSTIRSIFNQQVMEEFN